MGDDFLGIVLFAMLAAFLVFKLRGVLGKRTGHERPRQGPGLAPRSREAANEPSRDNVLHMPDRSDESDGVAEPESDLVAGITQIKAHDPSFDPEQFQAGAKMAFELIVASFANGDKEALDPLLDGDVFENFIRAVDEREKSELNVETTLVGIKSAELIEAEMQGRDALVTVKFVTDQINVTRDSAGEIVAGDPQRIVELTDIWTFQRNTRSSDPNWSLVATRTPN